LIIIERKTGQRVKLRSSLHCRPAGARFTKYLTIYRNIIV